MNLSRFLFLILSPAVFCTAANAAENQTGIQTASYLNEAYNNTVTDCYGGPAFLCSGVTFRGGQASENFHVWNPSPRSQASGGVSFSYIRSDAKFEKLAYGYTSGFILYPIYFSPKAKIDLDYLCAYPIDAATGNRNDKGCGSSSLVPNPEVSIKCSEQGIHTAEQWKNHWDINGNPGQCGFDISEATGSNTTERFYQSLRGTKLIDSINVIQNELVLATWDQNIGDVLPIQAFFYTSNSSNGLKDAQFYQRDFYETEGIWVPVIKFTLPEKITDDAQFSYNVNDQVIPEQ